MAGVVYVDAYRLNGQRLWRIDLGRNIRSGPHYTQFMVYDLDGDGLIQAWRLGPRGAVASLRGLLESLEELQVGNARRQGWSWQQIADALRVSRQAVHKKYRRYGL